MCRQVSEAETCNCRSIGLKGTLVEVKKNIFRNVLYPSGDAVYASPENIEYYKKYRQISIEEGIDYDMKQLMMKLSGLHLPVYMNPHESWTLSTDHLRVALRKQGVWVEAQNLIPPKTPVTLLGEFTFKIQMSNRLATHVRGTVVPIDEAGQPDLDTELPPMWGNEPLNEKAPLEYLKNTQETEPDAEDK
ncbi:RM09-like protein [Mya arenaria]|uniref:Large ribosomal subunit protein bL9m n=1 Tax=Mya arenaria TaxID=6604 RepID=A0ABY7FWD0_MYAAR|nr:RM09-like protein [Mya arenaria]